MWVMCNTDMLIILGKISHKFISQHTLEYLCLRHIFTKLISSAICVPINKLPISFQNRIRILSRFSQEEVKDIFSFLMRTSATCSTVPSGTGLVLSSRMTGDLLAVRHPPPRLAQGQLYLYFRNLWLGVIDLR